jgi:steroid delta-isomerase-like uncharacterized protein
VNARVLRRHSPGIIEEALSGFQAKDFKKRRANMAERSILEIAKSQITAYNDKNWPAAKESLAADVVYDEAATQRKIKGADGVLTAWKGWGTAFPDSKGSFDKDMVSGNTAVIELTWRGTHKGPLQLPGKELAATGKTIEIRACQIIEVSGGRVQAVRHYFDMATMLRQLGAMS